MPHDVAGLEVSVKEKTRFRFQQERREPLEIVLKGLLVEVDGHEFQEVVLEVIQVPPDRLLVEPAARITDREVHVAGGADLETGQVFEYLPVHLDQPVRKPTLFATNCLQFVEQGLVSQVLLEVDTLIQVLGIDFRNRKAVAAEVPR